LKLKDLVLACAPAKGLHTNTIRPCVPFVIKGASGLVDMACVANPHRWERDWGGTARRDPSRGNGLTGRPKPTLARSPRSRQHRSMASSP
jgi:hypothetical protein